MMEEARVNKIIMKSIENMSTPLKSVGMLRFYEELQLNEITEVLDIPRGTVNSRINKIKKLLREDLKNQGISPKNYSVAIVTPAMIYHAYYTLSEAYAVSVPVSEQIIKTISVAGAARTGSALIPKLLIGGKLASVALGVVVLTNQGETKEEDFGRAMIEPTPVEEVIDEVVEYEELVETTKISNITYNQNWTNQPIDLNVQMTNDK